MPDTAAPLPDFTRWPSFPFEGDIRVKALDARVDVEPPRKGEDPADCTACAAPDDAYIWVSDRWRVRAMDRPTGLPMVLILESRSHLDLGDLPNMLAAELGVMTVRLERAIRSLDDVARVHVNRSGDGEAHLHLWFLGRPQGLLQLRGPFLSFWDEILPPVAEAKWRENLALVAAWLAEFGGTPLAAPPRIDWKAPATLQSTLTLTPDTTDEADEADAEHANETDAAGEAVAERAGSVSGEGASVAGAQASATGGQVSGAAGWVPINTPAPIPAQAGALDDELAAERPESRVTPDRTAEHGEPQDVEPPDESSGRLRHPVPGASMS